MRTAEYITVWRFSCPKCEYDIPDSPDVPSACPECWAKKLAKRELVAYSTTEEVTP
jgi:predicted Zn-ribbon and HTH transcriptional regulator